MTNINVDKARELSRSNDLVKKILVAVAGRIRPRITTDLRRLRHQIAKDDGTIITNTAFAEAVGALERLGLGKLIVGRGRNPDRFKWAYNNVETAKLILGGADPNRNHTTKEPHPTYDEGVINVPYPLRGRVVTLPLPKDLTKKEAKELADFIQRFGQ